eukprot:231316-Hanusia_phi.AAC.2
MKEKRGRDRTRRGSLLEAGVRWRDGWGRGGESKGQQLQVPLYPPQHRLYTPVPGEPTAESELSDSVL